MMRNAKQGLLTILLCAGSTVGFSAFAQQDDWDFLGRKNMAEGQLVEAERNFMQALEVNPFDPVALNNLAVAKSEQGDFHSSMQLLERAARLAPHHPDIRGNHSRLRGWLHSYAGNELPAQARMGVPRTELGTGGLPPEPPALWTKRIPRRSVQLNATPVLGETIDQPRVIGDPIPLQSPEVRYEPEIQQPSTEILYTPNYE